MDELESDDAAIESATFSQSLVILVSLLSGHYEDVAEGSPPGTRRQMLAPLSNI
jgi:hypothetical protein